MSPLSKQEWLLISSLDHPGPQWAIRYSWPRCALIQRKTTHLATCLLYNSACKALTLLVLPNQLKQRKKLNKMTKSKVNKKQEKWGCNVQPHSRVPPVVWILGSWALFLLGGPGSRTLEIPPRLSHLWNQLSALIVEPNCTHNRRTASPLSSHAALDRLV